MSKSVQHGNPSLSARQADRGQPSSPDDTDRRSAPNVIAAYIHSAIALAVVLRGTVWIFSFFIVGPVFGMASYALSETNFGTAAPLVVEIPLAVLAVVVGVVIGIGVRRDADRWRRQAVVFGWILAVDVLWYVLSIVVDLVVWGGWPKVVELRWQVLVISLLNTGLLWMGLTIARRARRMRSQPRSRKGPRTRTGYRLKSRLPLR